MSTRDVLPEPEAPTIPIELLKGIDRLIDFRIFPLFSSYLKETSFRIKFSLKFQQQLDP